MVLKRNDGNIDMRSKGAESAKAEQDKAAKVAAVWYLFSFPIILSYWYLAFLGIDIYARSFEEVIVPLYSNLDIYFIGAVLLVITNLVFMLRRNRGPISVIGMVGGLFGIFICIIGYYILTFIYQWITSFKN